MAITYPLSLPTTPGITSVRFFRNSSVAINESQWTYASQVQVHAGQRWGAEFTLPIMTRAQAEPWQIVLLQLNGQQGTFLLGDMLNPSPQGTWYGVPLVNGGSQTGQSLAVDGLTPGATVVPGDLFQIGSRLYKYIGTSTAVADGSGQVTLDIWPRLRETPADNQAIITQSPMGTFRLADNSGDIYNSNAMEYYEVSLSAIEAV